MIDLFLVVRVSSFLLFASLFAFPHPRVPTKPALVVATVSFIVTVLLLA
jgi:hypothetical protein